MKVEAEMNFFCWLFLVIEQYLEVDQLNLKKDGSF